MNLPTINAEIRDKFVDGSARFSPNDHYFKAIKNISDEFGVDIGFNNTKTTFWITKREEE